MGAAAPGAAVTSGKILIVTNDFPPRRGGIESFVATLCAGLPAEDLVVYTASMPGSAAYDALLDYPVIRDGVGRLLPTARVGRSVRDVVRRYGCDRVVFGAAAPLGLLGAGLRRAGARRIVGLTHGHEVWWARTPGSRALLRRIGDAVDVLTFVSEYCRREIAVALSEPAARAMVRLSPGVDVVRFRGRSSENRSGVAPARSRGGCFRETVGIDSARPVVLAAARLVARKGHDTLLRAWPTVLACVPDAVLLIVGDGPCDRGLRRLASRLDLDAAVTFHSGVPWQVMPDVYAASDVFALPCRTRRRGLEVEALGIVFLEAAASGLPVVVGASGGAPETVVEGETGYVVDPVDPTAVGVRLVTLLRDPERAAAMGAAGRARVAAHWSDAHAVHTLQRLLA
jgi:phosphatidyl-myo-inositol dimannoside synthase